MKQPKTIMVFKCLTMLLLGISFYSIYLNLLDIIYLTDKELIDEARSDITKTAIGCFVYILYFKVTMLEHKLNE